MSQLCCTTNIITFNQLYQQTLSTTINKLHYLTVHKQCEVSFHFFPCQCVCVCAHTVTGFVKTARISCLTTSINIETSSLSSNLRILSKYWHSGIEVDWSIPYLYFTHSLTYAHTCMHAHARTHTHTSSSALSTLCSHQGSPGKINCKVKPTRNPRQPHMLAETWI